jgi:hypothetical protein
MGVVALLAGWSFGLVTDLIVSRFRKPAQPRLQQPQTLPPIFNAVPLIRCRYVGKSVCFWCPFCRVEHFHSWEPDDERGVAGKQHRTAHCRESTSPFHEKGYDIFVPEAP